MVGVPKCKTCFRCLDKRKRCDSRRPGCSQCQKRGVECPGYRASFRFVTASDPVDNAVGGEASSPPAACRELATFTQGHAAAVDDPYYESLQATAGQIELLARFHDVYYPHRRIGENPLRTDLRHLPSWEWVLPSLESSHGSPLLSDVVLALVLGSVGRRDLNAVYLHAGSLLHARAVNRLKTHLQNEQDRSSDETLAAVTVFGIYEIQVGSFARGKAWLAHVHGIDALLQLRGYSEDRSHLAKQLIWASQYNRWVIAMRSRGLTKPLSLQNASKERLPSDVQLFETLQCLAPLMAKVDRFFEIHDSCCAHQKYQVATSLLLEIDESVTQLCNWCHNLSTSLDKPIWWNEPSDLWICRPPMSPAPEAFATMLCFPSIRTATSLIFAWTGLLFLQRSKDLLQVVLASETVAAACADETALFIARSFEYFLHPDIGLFGTYMIGFPLSVSRTYFEHRKMHEAIQWLAVIECRIKEVGSGLCDFLKEAKSENILPRLSKAGSPVDVH